MNPGTVAVCQQWVMRSGPKQLIDCGAYSWQTDICALVIQETTRVHSNARL